MALAALFRAAGPDVEAKTQVTQTQIDRVAHRGPVLVGAFGRRNEGTDGSGDPSSADEDRLARAYELFFNAYNTCRRAVGYLRWDEGDAELRGRSSAHVGTFLRNARAADRLRQCT